MVKFNFKKIAAGLAVAFMAFGLAACGGVADEEVFVWPDYIDRQTLFYGQTLTIGVSANGREGMRLVPFVNAYMRANPGVNIEFIYLDGDIERTREQIAVQFMAGTAPMLVPGHHVQYPNMHNHDMFANWFPLMEAHPHFNEADWQMNVFDAFAMDGRLLGLSPTFQYMYVMVNSAVPGLAEATAGRDSITLAEMIELYEHFYDPLNSKMIMNGFDVRWALTGWHTHNFFDFNTGYVNFNNQEFIELITQMRGLTNPHQLLGHPRQIGRPGDRYLELEWSQRYMFRQATSHPFEYFSIFDENTIFVNPLLVVNDDGELLIHGAPSETWLLSAGATPIQRALAMDFILFIAGNENDTLRLESLFSPAAGFLNAPWFPSGAPVNRYLLYRDGNFAFANMLNQLFINNNWRLAGTQEEADEKIFARMHTAAEMPMARPFHAPWLITDLINEHLELFNSGLQTAQQTAENLQNSVTLAMMEVQ